MVSLARWLPGITSAAVLALVLAIAPLGAISRAIAIACVLAAFGAAAFLGRRDVRAHASVVAAIAAVTAAGQVDVGPAYGVAVAVFLLGCVHSLRVARRTAPVPAENRRIAAILITTAAVAAIAVTTLPPLAAKIERTVTGMLGVDFSQQTAFSTSMQLGSTNGMLKSDAIVARIDGAMLGGRDKSDYLRGAVYDRYDFSRWITTQEGRSRTTIPATPGGPTHIELDRHAPTGSDLRWFLPPTACGFDHDVEVDFFGVARRQTGSLALSFATSGCTPPVVRPPTTTDLEVPYYLVKDLTPIAERWTATATSDHDKLKQISDELARYEYSLDVPRQANLDPILDFLTVHKAGHCEFYASSLVLLARTQGIHARVVGGYRVSEINPITKQAIIRDRNAHSWVEAWYDGAWHAWDPTPITDGPGSLRTFVDHVGDLWALAWDKLRSIGPLGYAVILTGLIVVLLVIRAVGNWLRRPRRRRNEQSLERPLPCFEALTDALAKAGFARDDAEPIEAFAERIPHSEVASALLAYAAFRYGGIGEEKAVVGLTEKAVRFTSSLPPHRT